MPDRHNTAAGLALALALVGIATANAQSLCDDFHVPAAHIGHVESCVFDGSTMTTITFSAPTILEWRRGFRIGRNQHLRFAFPGIDNGAVLNRDVSGGFSNIGGTVSSDGRVLLVNPGGHIAIQPGALIDADGGFLASTLDTADDDALLAGAGGLFQGNPDSRIDNWGTIRSTGGDVILISGNVNNFASGRIAAPSGSVHAGAGRIVRLFDAGEPRIMVEDGNPIHFITNSGDIEAANAIGFNAFVGDNTTADSAIQNLGRIRATSPGGRVFLRAPGGTVRNSDSGVIDAGVVAVIGGFTNEGIMLNRDDGANPGPPTATRQFTRLTSSNLSQIPNNDFRLLRASFSHVNGLESTVVRKAKPVARTSTRVSATTTRGTAGTAKKKTTPSGKKIVARRSAFFGKRSR